jgi:hypothetical protein
VVLRNVLLNVLQLQIHALKRVARLLILLILLWLHRLLRRLLRRRLLIAVGIRRSRNCFTGLLPPLLPPVLPPRATVAPASGGFDAIRIGALAVRLAQVLRCSLSDSVVPGNPRTRVLVAAPGAPARERRPDADHRDSREQRPPSAVHRRLRSGAIALRGGLHCSP